MQTYTDKLVFAVDFYNHRVQTLDKSGTFLSAFGVKSFRDRQFRYSFGVTIAKESLPPSS